MNIKELRAMAGLSQAQFAKKYGMSIRTVESWESGKRTIAPWVLALLERAVKEDYKQ